MKKCFFTLAALLFFFSSRTHANEQVARDNQCFKCHEISSRKKAPPFQSISRNFRNNTNNIDEIAYTIRNGITSLFGVEKMPANKHLSDDEIKSITQWILQQ